MPGPLSAVDRRRVLTGAGMLALLAVAAPACGSAPTPAVDDLEAQRLLAHRDSELAAAAGAALTDAASPDTQALIAALDQVALERGEHARALAAEITRTTRRPPAEDPAVATSATVAAGPAPTVAQVITALRAAADSAGKLAVQSSGYRAGLLASIAAACTASSTVSLAAQS
ncbi:hypothetical protein [Mycolicibacter minnesotensis]